MKKILLVSLMVLIMTLMFAQTTINFDDAAKWTAGSVSLTSYAVNHTYVDGVFSATGGPALRNTTSTQDGQPGAFGTYSWRLTNASADWRITISSGGVASFSMDIRRWDGSPSPAYALQYSLDGGSNWTDVAAVNNTTLDNSSAFKTFNGTVNSSNSNIIIRLYANSTTERIMVDNFIWTGFSGGGNTPPVITDVVRVPLTDITSLNAVSVSAEVNDDDTVTLVELQWGYAADNFPSSIEMIEAKGSYVSNGSIPGQPDGTTVYYRVYAEDNDDDHSFSTVYNYTVNDPATTTVPYLEDFAAGLGDCYTYSVTGSSKYWLHSSGGAYAYMNGFGSTITEEDWMILPSIDFDAYDDLILSFDSWYRYGTDNEANYLKLMYSTDYAGLGSPALATWTEIAFTKPAAEQVWTSSGNLDLSGISGTSVWLAFKYNYDFGLYRSWQIDNISILEAVTPLLDVNPSTLSGFSYVFESGPSDEQSFVVSGTSLSDDVVITAPAHYQISETSGSGFGSEIVLSPSKADLGNTTIYVQLAAGLSAGSYSSEDIVVSSTGAMDKTVTCSGSVTPPPPVPGYFVDFEGEGETKGAYGSGTVNLSGLNWDMTEAVIGTLANDWKYGLRSARMRGYGTSSMTMLEDKTDGAGTVSFSYSRYGTDTQVDWKVEYSTDGGNIWTQLGSSFTAPASSDVSNFYETLNISGNIRIRIKRATEAGTSTARLNIDDINISHHRVIPDGVPVVISGVEVLTDLELDYDNTLEIDDPQIPVLPNSANLVDPVVILFSADAGTTDITLNLGAGTWYAVAYYNGDWQQGNPYPLVGPGSIVFTGVPFGSKADVPVVVSENEDPTLPVELSSAFATVTAQNFVNLTWTTQTETAVQGFYIYRGSNPQFSEATKISGLIEATNSSQQHTYNYLDNEIDAIGTYYYWLQVVDFDGSASYHGPMSATIETIGENGNAPSIGIKTGIASIYPNPFNPNAYVGYRLAKDSNVNIAIYNTKGQLVRNLLNASKDAGHHNIQWDGKDNSGTDCGTGIYYIRMQAENKTFTKKAMLLK